MPMGMGNEMPAISSVEDYYKIEFSNDKLEKKLDKDKYANVASDQMLQRMKQAAEFGIPVSHTYIINLPRPVEKAEGKKIKLSEDKKRITVTTGLDDFFDNPESLEFKVKF
jgi:fructose-1,6-bisphosphatase